MIIETILSAMLSVTPANDADKAAEVNKATVEQAGKTGKVRIGKTGKVRIGKTGKVRIGKTGKVRI